MSDDKPNYDAIIHEGKTYVDAEAYNAMVDLCDKSLKESTDALKMLEEMAGALEFNCRPTQDLPNPCHAKDAIHAYVSFEVHEMLRRAIESYRKFKESK